MKQTIINNVSRDNYKKVLQKLELMGVKWRSGDKPTDTPIFDTVYTVGLYKDNELTYGETGSRYFSKALRVSAVEFLNGFEFNQIVITRKGRKVTAEDQDGNRASARCCPEDTFDFYEGAKLALERLKEETRGIKAGDNVRVTNPGKTFSTLPSEFFTTDDELRRYVFGEEPNERSIYKVKRVGPDGKLYIDHDLDYSGLYVIGPEGVEKVKK